MVRGLRSVCLLSALAIAAHAAELDIPRTLKGVEDRYNRAKTIRVTFTETYSAQRGKIVEKGELYLRKPGRMRWEYTSPAGKLFVSDNKFLYSYVPEEKRADKMLMKETEDLRAPLAFLLGRLQFDNDFKEFRGRLENGGTFITAIPKSDKMPYEEVSFLAGGDFSIRRLIVKGHDRSTIEFVFENEKVNMPIADAMFQFAPPPGVEYVDLTKQ
jgi:outer membrane lipoprotein carrier protein